MVFVKCSYTGQLCLHLLWQQIRNMMLLYLNNFFPFTRIPLMTVATNVYVCKHSGSIPRNARVACENIAMRDYQESVTTGQTHTQTDRRTDARQSDPYVPLCFTGDTKMQCFAGDTKMKYIFYST